MLNLCGGTLVGGKTWLPTEAAFFSRGLPWIGCNRLVCKQCDAPVSHADDRGVSSHYLPSGIDPLTMLRSGPAFDGDRAYFCRCGWLSVSAFWRIHVGETESTSHLDWDCAGHPDDDAGTEVAKVVRRGELFRQAMCVPSWKGTTVLALDAWEPLVAIAGDTPSARINTFNQLMSLTQDARIRGRAALALSALRGEDSEARSVLAATIANSNDEAAKDEARVLLADLG